MKEYLLGQLDRVEGSGQGRRIVREVLQARMLEVLQAGGVFASWAFVGGTALRFLYALPRFSEDIDFSLVQPGLDDGFERLLGKAQSHFESEGYDVSIRARTDKTVKSAMVKFTGLLYELGLSPHASENVSIKVELDTNPPAGAGLTTSIIRRHCLLNLQHYDRASLLAGKLNALLTRAYTKGRDVYDLLWYLSDRTWPGPNVDLLNNALAQSGWQGPPVTPDNWRRIVAEWTARFDWPRVIADVQPFLERPQDLDLLTQENIHRLLNPEA